LSALPERHIAVAPVRAGGSRPNIGGGASADGASFVIPSVSVLLSASAVAIVRTYAPPPSLPRQFRRLGPFSRTYLSRNVSLLLRVPPRHHRRRVRAPPDPVHDLPLLPRGRGRGPAGPSRGFRSGRRTRNSTYRRRPVHHHRATEPVPFPLDREGLGHQQ